MVTLTPGSSIGKFPYYLQKRINDGQGGMSEVYLAAVGLPTDQRPRPPWVVLKIARMLDEHGEFHHAALDNEVARLRRLKHPGIVRLYPIRREGMPNLPYMAQSGLEGKPWFSVMEYLPGGSLADLIQPESPLDMGLALEIARSLAATLDYLHNQGQVHLDIKPENILFRSDPLGARIEPVLIDFGIARDIGQSGLEGGTLKYYPPERLRTMQGHAQPPEVAPRPHPSMDIYSLGIVLYYMLTGHWPFEGRTHQTLKSAILEGNPTIPSKYKPTLSPELDELILKTINKDPRQRPTAEELAVALETAAIKLGYEPGWLPGEALQPKREAIRPPGRAIGSLRPLLIGLGGVIAAVVIFTVGFLMGSNFKPTTDTTLAAMPTPMDTPSPVVEMQEAVAPINTPIPEVTMTPAKAETLLAGTPTTRKVAATPEPGRSLNSTATPTSTPRPTSTPVPTLTETPVLVVSLMQPQDGQAGSGVYTFVWQANRSLLEGQFFELVLWKQDQDPLDPAQAPGVAELTRDFQVKVGLTKLVDDPSHPLTQGNYFWGIFLVKTNPYKRLELLSERRQFRVD